MNSLLCINSSIVYSCPYVNYQMRRKRGVRRGVVVISLLAPRKSIVEKTVSRHRVSQIKQPEHCYLFYHGVSHI